jgi:hypothetical protein
MFVSCEFDDSAAMRMHLSDHDPAVDYAAFMEYEREVVAGRS